MDSPRRFGMDAPDSLAVLFIALILIFVIVGGCGGYYYYNRSGCDCGKCDSCSTEPFVNGPPGGPPLNTYNALYTNSIQYTQPMGDVKAQKAAGVGQGTNGGFMPIYGIGSGSHMESTDEQNNVIPGPFPGKIGGQANITDQEVSTRWIGFNNFGKPFDLPGGENRVSNSYLLEGDNERVADPGRSDDLTCPSWWPTVKRSNGFCIQASDLMTTGNHLDLLAAEKDRSQWRKVVSP